MNKISQAPRTTTSKSRIPSARKNAKKQTATETATAAKELHKKSSRVLEKLEHGSRLFESLKKVYPLDNLDRDEKTIEPMHFALWDAIDDKSPWGETENKAANKFIKLFYEHMKEHPEEGLPSRIKFLIHKTNIADGLKEMVLMDLKNQGGEFINDEDDYYRLGSMQRDILSQISVQETASDISHELNKKPESDISNHYREALENSLKIIEEQHRQANQEEKNSFVKIVRLISANLSETKKINGRFPENKLRILSMLFKHLKANDLDDDIVANLKESTKKFTDYKYKLSKDLKKYVQRIQKSQEALINSSPKEEFNGTPRAGILSDMFRIVSRKGPIDGQTLKDKSIELIHPDNAAVDDDDTDYFANMVIQRAVKELQSDKIDSQREKSFLPELIYNILSIIDSEQVYPETIEAVKSCSDQIFQGSITTEKIKERIKSLTEQVVEL